MKTHILTGCSYVSTMVLLGFMILFLYAWRANPDPRSRHVSLGDRFNVAVTSNRGGQVVVFSDPQSGPYTGSILVLVFGDGQRSGRRVTGFGEMCGVYFRSIKDVAWQKRNWTFMISFWNPIAIFTILPLFCLTRKWRRANRSKACAHENDSALRRVRVPKPATRWVP